VSGQCVCDATSCPNGCCDASGVCQPGNTNAVCGTGGVTCFACSPAGNNCESGECSTAVWTDPITGYMWQNGATVGSDTYDQSDAASYCAGLSWGGYDSGWQLPDIDQLRSLIRGCADTQTGGACGVTDSCLDASCLNAACFACTCCGPGPGGAFWPPEITGNLIWYWSSSPVEDPGCDCVWWWTVDFYNGYGDGGDVEESENEYFPTARCVRP
jgi:hypothetical protein